MFGQNQIVGTKFFSKEPTNTLLVTSVFFTLQGEGPYSGQPAVFVRLAKCNLACSFCDTFFDQGDQLPFDEVFNKIDSTINKEWDKGAWEVQDATPLWALDVKAVPPQKRYPGVVLVVTGGEPLLQRNLTDFLKVALTKFKNVQVESNGIPETEVPYGVTLVCSPKCAEKDGKPTKYLLPSNTILERADCLKFVLSADPDSPYSKLPEWAFQWVKLTGKPVYISPMNVYNDLPHKAKMLRANNQGTISLEERSTVDEVVSFWEPGLLNMVANQKNHEYAARYCMKNGFRLNLQVHLFASLA